MRAFLFLHSLTPTLSRRVRVKKYPVKFEFGSVARAILTTGLLVTALPLPAADADGARLVQERRCYPCHNLTETLIGPPYQAIAERHAKNKDAMAEVLAEKIILGGAGNWGVVPMVPNEQVSPAEARVIAKWILDQEKK